jgi:hypothetical protein
MFDVEATVEGMHSLVSDELSPTALSRTAGAPDTRTVVAGGT